MKKLSEDKLQHIFRRADHYHIHDFANAFNKYAELFGITEDVHVNFILAQIREEVGTDLIAKRENLNYSCKALKALFGYYKRNHAAANIDGRCSGHKANQRAIANHAYGGRIGNKEHNDGWKYRGGGFIQLTGRSNYNQASEVISLALGKVYTPDDVESEIDTVEGALLTAMAFWFTHKLYNCKSINEVTAKVNKHTHSYEQRKEHYKYIASL